MSRTTKNGMSGAWKAKNKRRIHLIDKQLSIGLGAEETEELARLQTEVGQEVASLHPIPIQDLREIRKRLRRAVLEPDEERIETTKDDPGSS